MVSPLAPQASASANSATPAGCGRDANRAETSILRSAARVSRARSGTAEAIAAALPATRWVRLSAGAGGPRLYDYLELADLDARSFFDCRSASTMWTLLIRRGLSDGKMAFFSTWCPKGTPMAVLVEVEGRRWAIAFETAKTELAHNEAGMAGIATSPW